MTTDTIVSIPSIPRKKPIEAIISDNNDDIDLFSVYLEFIIYRIKTDIESYRQALVAVPGNEVKLVLSSMATKKESMHDALIAYRTYDRNDMFTLAFDTSDQYATVDFILDTYFKPFQSVIDAFHFAYRKEYENLKLFENVGRSSRLNAAIRTLLESAVEHQRRHILHLDALFAEIVNAEASATGQSVSAGNDVSRSERTLTMYLPPSDSLRSFSSDSAMNPKEAYYGNYQQ